MKQAQKLIRAVFGAIVFLCLAVVTIAQTTFLTTEDFTRINQQAKQSGWAAQIRTDTLEAAKNWQQNYQRKYGLDAPELPPEGGQWSMWYVCKLHGTKLKFAAPNRHICPTDNQVYSGWPYDQVGYANRHNDLGAAALNNGLAYQLTKEISYAQTTAKILLQYADRYLEYPLHDVNNKVAGRGAHVTPQTLDEAIWLIDIAWSYDLIAESGALKPAEKEHIVTHLLRAAVSTIQRVDGKENNWQSWHNAALGAVGFVTHDQELIKLAIDGPSGFRFQMRQSVLGEGVWYEGSWGYHFYALDALVKLAEMASRNGIDLWSEPNLRKLFELPLHFSFGGMTLPAFNDSVAVNLTSYCNLYELAYAHYKEPLFALPLQGSKRSRSSLFWGAENLPATPPLKLKSEIFPLSGYAALRGESNDFTLLMKFGPHGGAHGHFDKLNFVSFANGNIQSVDPGRQAYSLASHNTWDKQTVAHNTIVVDEKSQDEATGKMLWSSLQGPMKAVRGEAGQAYRQASLERTIYFTDDYAVDVVEARATDNKEHLFDWVYHNFGQLQSQLKITDYQAFPSANGYQHLTKNRAAIIGDEWQADFVGASFSSQNFGSVYPSTSAVKGTFRSSKDQAATGNMSGLMEYNFAGEGYLLYSTPTLKIESQRKPRGVALMVYGDNSGNKLSLRINDAMDERFVYSVGTINWSGWRLIEAFELEKWTHYLGNKDGVVDLPLKTISVQLDHAKDAPSSGKIYVDDIALIDPENQRNIIANFEQPAHNMRVWMQGVRDTTVVAGQGLGPDLLQPVPYVMARRKGRSARFITLFEPYTDAPRIKIFRASDANSFEVSSAKFKDIFSVQSDGRLSYKRQLMTP